LAASHLAANYCNQINILSSICSGRRQNPVDAGQRILAFALTGKRPCAVHLALWSADETGHAEGASTLIPAAKTNGSMPTIDDKVSKVAVATEKQRPRVMRGLDSPISGHLSAAEEQPEQNDDRNRHAQKPQQQSFSHCPLLRNDISGEERTVRVEVPVSSKIAADRDYQ
jgi:hypothetical protein